MNRIVFVIALLAALVTRSAGAEGFTDAHGIVFTEDPALFKGDPQFYRVEMIYFDAGECVIDILPISGEAGGYFSDHDGNELAKIMATLEEVNQTWFTIEEIMVAAGRICWPTEPETLS